MISAKPVKQHAKVGQLYGEFGPVGDRVLSNGHSGGGDGVLK